jgi:hypothetical protein
LRQIIWGLLVSATGSSSAMTTRSVHSPSDTLRGFHALAFAILMLTRVIAVMVQRA